ncbi:unnamed protein product [Paramecium primaurelia]|uniref:Uncharacterized protein n=2 Tax=Paramecium TaxID=5884 RepID=A0A8S1Y1P9_9CILI|nr:unnamed protein product [Paramecium primaurelia]CAD8207703.1 unnamed protein product [Paramecium pentaurelia]
MLNRAINIGFRKALPQYTFSSRNGPYNPNRYRHYLNPNFFQSNKEIADIAKSQQVPLPVRNVRHVNPVRQSGPLPPYDGPYTMEDVRAVWQNTSIGRQGTWSCQMDPDEIMRRVPGITRREVEKILNMGLTPQEQVDFAYLVYNCGFDVDYTPNSVYVARQVVTNSKGEKVEILWNVQVLEDLAKLPVGFAPVRELIDYHWEIFLWSDPMIKPTGDLDLGVPNTWFEYECEWGGEMVGIEDQFNIPESDRVFPSPKNPNCRRELWKSQDDIQEQLEMEDENWYPKGTSYNIYQQADYKKVTKSDSTFQEKI